MRPVWTLPFGICVVVLVLRAGVLNSRMSTSTQSFRRVDRAWQIRASGPGAHGCSLMDFDRDGDIDIYITSFWTGVGRRQLNQLFVQEAPGRFVDRAGSYGLTMPDTQTHDAVWLDYDGDGREDLFVAATVGVHRLWRQTANGFVDVSEAAGIRGMANSGARAVLAGDVNGDGRVDVFVLNNGDIRGVPVANQLWIARANGTFRDEAWTRGVADPRPVTYDPWVGDYRGVGQGATMVDIDEDGDLDILVCVREMNLRLFENDGRGRFVERASVRGIRLSRGCDGVTVADLDLDGRLDIVTVRSRPDTWVHFFYQTETGFVDRTGQMAIPGNAYSPALADLDLDGYPDLILARRDQRLTIYHNDAGNRFTPWVEGIPVGRDPRGVCTGDLDGDGDTDVLVVHKSDTHVVLQNLLDPPGQIVDLQVWAGMRDTYGTEIKAIDVAGRLRAHMHVVSGYGYLSHAPTWRIAVPEFPAAIPVTVEIRFPWGLTVRWHGGTTQVPIIRRPPRWP